MLTDDPAERLALRGLLTHRVVWRDAGERERFGPGLVSPEVEALSRRGSAWFDGEAQDA